MSRSKPTATETLNWLRSNYRLEINVIPSQENEFRRLYRAIKGRYPLKKYYTVASTPKTKGGDQFRLVIPAADRKYQRVLEKQFGLAPLRTTQDGRGWRKTSKQFVYQLLAFGFDIAPNRGRTGQTSGRAGRGPLHLPAEERLAQFFEGFKQEITREMTVRSRGLIQAAKRSRPAICEVCGFSFTAMYGDLGKGFIEAHHRLPIAAYGRSGRAACVDDIALVCANCHRMLHVGKRIMLVEELGAIVESRRTKIQRKVRSS